VTTGGVAVTVTVVAPSATDERPMPARVPVRRRAAAMRAAVRLSLMRPPPE
jgi:hypothetical protein